MARNIGLANVPIPSDTCEDPNCPFHGKLPIRGQVLGGIVIGSKMDKTVVVERTHERKIFKYERYEKRSSRIHAHNPPCLNAKEGDTVKIAECRPLSKTKSFVVVSIT